MQRPLLLSTLLLITATASAQETVTISTNAQNADQVYYSLANGIMATRPLAEWDLAFEITGFTSSILVNTAKGNKVYHVGPAGDWDATTAATPEAWTALANSETSWNAGALTHGADGGFNLGWGTYDMDTHIVTGTELFAIELAGGTWKKLRIDGLVTGTYHFTYADIDGSDEQTGTLVKTAFQDKVFGYWDLSAHAAVDREPAAAQWGLLFTKYLSDLGGTMYPVAGVLHNKGVQVAQLDGVDPVSVYHAQAEGQYSSDINTIGSDWKTFNGSAYVYADDRVYYVKGVDGALWKLIFTGYGGGATGTMTFTQELVSAVSVNDIARSNGQVMVHPNPTMDGRAQLVLDVPAEQAMLTVHDLAGRAVFAEQLTGIGTLTVRTIDLAHAGAGAYVVRVEHERGVATTRLIVQ
ncbi:MAG: HmuY family protein [Flavobacteriales bacterium]|jgi:hypothetical protein|nr:HmuY family protein [Flavobacteriales bacterium]